MCVNGCVDVDVLVRLCVCRCGGELLCWCVGVFEVLKCLCVVVSRVCGFVGLCDCVLVRWRVGLFCVCMCDCVCLCLLVLCGLRELCVITCDCLCLRV